MVPSRVWPEDSDAEISEVEAPHPLGGGGPPPPPPGGAGSVELPVKKKARGDKTATTKKP